MKRFGLLAFCLLLLPSVAFSEVHFKTMTMQEAMKLAKKEKKAIMVDFYTDWCVWCKVLDRDTYSDKKISEFADDHFIALRLNAEKEDGEALAKQYQVAAYPTVLFFDASGKVLSRVVGYQDTGAFGRSMEIAVSGGLKGLQEKVSGKKGAMNLRAWMTLGDYYMANDRPKDALPAYDHILAMDPLDSLHYFEQALYAKGFAVTDDTRWGLLETAVKQYPNRPEARRAMTALIMNDFNSMSPERAGPRMDDWAAQHGMEPDLFNMFAWEAAKRGILLDRAEDYATRAVMLYPDVHSRADALDTKAVVVAKEGRPNDAVIYETEAISLLPNDDKRMKEFTDRKAEFEKQASGGSMNGDGTQMPANPIAH